MNRIVRFLLFATALLVGTLSVFFLRHSPPPTLGEAGLAAVADAVAQTSEPLLVPSRTPEPVRDRAELLAEAAAREVVDLDWAPTMERRIAERFASKAPPGFALLSTTCKTSICVAEVETPSREATRGVTGWHSFFGASSGHIHHEGEDGDGFRTVVYLARAGHSLPR